MAKAKESDEAKVSKGECTMERDTTHQGATVWKQKINGVMRKHTDYYLEKGGTLVGPLTKRMLEEQIVFDRTNQ